MILVPIKVFRSDYLFEAIISSSEATAEMRNRDAEAFDSDYTVKNSRHAYFITNSITCPKCDSKVLLPGGGRNFGICMDCDTLISTEFQMRINSTNRIFRDAQLGNDLEIRTVLSMSQAERMKSTARPFNNSKNVTDNDFGILAYHVKIMIQVLGLDEDTVNPKNYFVV